MEPALFLASLIFYALAAAAAYLYLFSRSQRWSVLTLHLLGAGLALHLASFLLRLRVFWVFPENRYLLPVHGAFGALSALALALAVTFFLVERTRRLGILGAFVLPWIVLFSGAAALAKPALAPLPPELRSPWMNLHPVLLTAAYAVFTNAFGVGLALLVEDRQLKSRAPAQFCYGLPSLDELDRLHRRITAAGLALLLAGIFMGAMWARRAWTAPWGWDAKLLGAYATAAWYAAYLYMHAARGWRGRRGVCLAMCGFATLVLTFLGGDFMSRLHGYVFRGG